MNRYFSSFQKSREGGRSPQKNSRGDTSPPPPPVPPGIAAYGIASKAIPKKQVIIEMHNWKKDKIKSEVPLYG